MVHWPEVMMTYESSEKILFAADGFGKFGALDAEEDWACEARRYYIGIVGKYGAQVQSILKKAAGLDIEKICPLHGPVLQKIWDITSICTIHGPAMNLKPMVYAFAIHRYMATRRKP